ncbi:MAG: transposase zinc-binding domain-containing protein [Planctomycetota bacterium]|nr:transposase zinc-binding domain-containing protein [Planctomycetota bacterium]
MLACQTRNVCGSCQQKRALLLAEKLRAEILAPVEHRHVIFTIPVVLRGIF